MAALVTAMSGVTLVSAEAGTIHLQLAVSHPEAYSTTTTPNLLYDLKATVDPITSGISHLELDPRDVQVDDILAVSHPQKLAFVVGHPFSFVKPCVRKMQHTMEDLEIFCLAVDIDVAECGSSKLGNASLLKAALVIGEGDTGTASSNFLKGCHEGELEGERNFRNPALTAHFTSLHSLQDFNMSVFLLAVYDKQSRCTQWNINAKVNCKCLQR